MKEYSQKKFPNRISSAPPDEGEPELRLSFNLKAEPFKPMAYNWTQANNTYQTLKIDNKVLRSEASSFVPQAKLSADTPAFVPVMSASKIDEIQEFRIEKTQNPYEKIEKPANGVPEFTAEIGNILTGNAKHSPEENTADLAQVKNVENTNTAPSTETKGRAEAKTEVADKEIVKNQHTDDTQKKTEEKNAGFNIGAEEFVISAILTEPSGLQVLQADPTEKTPDLQPEILETELAASSAPAKPGKKQYTLESIKQIKSEYMLNPNFFDLPKAILEIKERCVEVFKIPKRSDRGTEKKRERICKSSWRKAKTAEEEKISKKAKEYSRKFSIPLPEQEKIKKQIRITLNKLSPNNQEKLTNDILETSKKSYDYLKLVVAGIFEKAWAENKYTKMYSEICKSLKTKFENFVYENAEGKLPETKNYFRYELLYMCEETFRKHPEESDFTGLGPEERQEKLTKMKKKILGNVRFIGELFIVCLIRPKIVLGCVHSLIDLFEQENNEDRLEGACLLLETGGSSLERPKLQCSTNAIFDRLDAIYNSFSLSSKIKFKLMDLQDLRKGGWKNLHKNQLKTVEEIHADFQHEQNEILRKNYS